MIKHETQSSDQDRALLAGEVGFGPPSFVGLIGVASVGAVKALAIASTRASLITIVDAPPASIDQIATTTGLSPEVILPNHTAAPAAAAAAAAAAGRAIDDLHPGRIEWTSGNVPQPQTWNASAAFVVARVVGSRRADPTPELLLTFTHMPVDRSFHDAVDQATGSPVLHLGPTRPNRDRQGTAASSALSWAVASALAVLPPAGTRLHLDQVVESGAPLAVWRPRPASAVPDLLKRTGDGWQLGRDVCLHHSSQGWQVELRRGAFVREDTVHDHSDGWTDDDQ